MPVGGSNQDHDTSKLTVMNIEDVLVLCFFSGSRGLYALVECEV